MPRAGQLPTSVRIWAALAVLALGFLLALGPLVSAAPAPAHSISLSGLFDCSQTAQSTLERQMNFRAAQILAHCRGEKVAEQQSAAFRATASFKALRPDSFGGADQDVILPDHPIYPKVTQSESMVWGHGNTV